MPIEKTIADSMLDPFRNMVKDVDAKKLSGKDVDEMKAAMATMERLAREMSDVVSFSTKMAADNIYMNFSNACGRALAAAASASQPTDDASLMTQSLQQYQASYDRLKDDPNNQHLVPPLVRALEIGKSGVSYPVFLRRCEEEGLFEEMRNGRLLPVLEFDLHVATVMGDPVRVEMYAKTLEAYRGLCAAHPFGLADTLEFEVVRTRLSWEYAPRIAKWKAIIERWDKMHDMVFDWLDAHCSFAPFDDRWRDVRGERFTRENIQRTQECVPGQLAVREAIFKEYFGLAWDDVFTHETYAAEQKASRVWNSDERIALLRQTYPFCKPGGKPPAGAIAKNEVIFKDKTYRNPRNIKRFGDANTKGPGYDFAKFSEFVKKNVPR